MKKELNQKKTTVSLPISFFAIQLLEIEGIKLLKSFVSILFMFYTLNEKKEEKKRNKEVRER